jgi:hypothetical protein
MHGTDDAHPCASVSFALLSAAKRALDISTRTDGYDLAVVGESHYQMTLRRLAGSCSRATTARGVA